MLNWYLLLINALSFVLMLIDKKKAKKNQWRIPERVLLLLAVCGGSLGTWMAMYAVRHKTRHKTFTVGVPIMLLIHIFVAAYLYLH